MRLVVRLAGEPLPWRYKDSDRLGDWIDARPWAGPPSSRVIRVADRDAAAPVLAAIHDAVAAADGGRTGVGAVEPDPAVAAASGFAAAAAEYLGANPRRPDAELAKIVGRGADGRPTVWLVPPLPVERPQLVHETAGFLDLLAKLVPSARLAVVFTDTPASPLTGMCFDITAGGPPAGSEVLTAADARAWSHYLHRRLAWEAGGHRARAERRSAAVDAAGVRLGDDERLEAVLNREAEADYAGLSDAEKAGIAGGIEACVRSAGLTDPPAYFWNPAHLIGAAPVPWVARALLRSTPARADAEFLRGSMLCLPLSQELLTACFLIESHIRARVRLPAAPPDEAKCRETWDRFRAGKSMAASLYPPSYPAPTGPWAFAALGEILAHAPNAAPGSDWRHDARELRNHLAHGHHPGWAAVVLTRRLASRLGR